MGTSDWNDKGMQEMRIECLNRVEIGETGNREMRAGAREDQCCSFLCSKRGYCLSP